MWEYPAKVLRVIDADTLELRIDLGFYVSVDADVRVAGFDAPEAGTKAGQKATSYAVALLRKHKDKVIVATQRDPERSFARYVADVRLDSGPNYAEAMIKAGHIKEEA